MKIFELRDTSNDEMYFPLGLFLSLDEAFAAIDKVRQDSPETKPPCEEEDEWDEYIRLEIHSRPLGFGGSVLEWTAEYKRTFNEETDSYFWRQVNMKSSQAIAAQPG